jgi:hypothetical protein
MCAGGALCGCSRFGLVVCALCLSFVLSRMCRAVVAVQQCQIGLTGGYRSDRCATTQSRIFEAEDTRQDCMASVEATQGAIAGHPSDGEILKTSKTALQGLVSLVIRKGYIRLSVASI